MDIIWVSNTGLWISAGISFIVLVPLILEFSKQNLPIIFGIILFLFTIKGLSSQSPEMQNIWIQLSQVPHKLSALTTQLTGIVLP